MIVKAPLQHFPYQCALTGRDGGEMVDTGRDAPTHPNLPTRLYLHAPTLRDLARNELDMVPGKDVRELEGKVREMGVRLAELMEQVEALTAAKRVIDQIEGEPCQAK